MELKGAMDDGRQRAVTTDQVEYIASQTIASPSIRHDTVGTVKRPKSAGSTT
jgi:hypothetical protein